MIVRPMEERDITAIKGVLKGSEPFLAVYTNYVYWILASYYAGSCYVAEADGVLAGFVSALPSPEQNCLFLWQIGVDQAWRGKGIGKVLLDRVAAYAADRAIPSLQFSINRDNASSHALFQSFAKKRGSHLKRIGEFVLESGAEQELLYEIAL